MSERTFTTLSALLAGCLLLTACGGGGPSFGGGISGTGKPTVTVGTITATDTLTVAGTAFETSATNVSIGGDPASTGDLRVGMTATVAGIDDGTVVEAETVEVDVIVQGALEAKPDASTVVVFGQTVGVDETTVYGPGIDPPSLAGLTAGDYLEVYGYVLSSGRAFATRIEREDAQTSLRLLGIAAAVDPTARTFLIGTQLVDYAGADTSELPGGEPHDGQLLDVRGPATLGPSNELVATEVRAEDLDDQEDNDQTQVEGYVTDVVSPTRFHLGSVTVDTTPTTVFEGGSAVDVAVGVRLDVEGVLSAGILTARHVAFDSDVRLQSDVATAGGDTITLVGLPGLTITVSSLTEFDGDASEIGDLQAGDHVEIRGRASGATSVAAAQVKETGADTDIEIQGPLDAVPAPSNPWLWILGVAIDTSSVEDGEFQGPGETALDATDFFAAVEPGMFVRVSGELAGGVPTWDQAEIESEEDD